MVTRHQPLLFFQYLHDFMDDFGRFSFFYRVGDAGFHVIFEDHVVYFTQCRLDSYRLVDNVNAVVAIFDHVDDAI